MAVGWSLTWRKDRKQWVVSYATATGQKQKLVPREHASKKDASAWWVGFMRETRVDPGALIRDRADVGPRVREVAERWYLLRQRLAASGRIADATYIDNRRDVEKAVVPKFGELPIAELDTKMLRAFFLEMAEKRSVSRTRNIFYSFRTMYADAMAEEWVKSQTNPLDHPNVKRILPESGSDRVGDKVTVVPIEVAQMLVTSEKVPAHRGLRYLAAFTTLARDGELSAILVSDLHLDDAIPYVEITKSLCVRTNKLKKTKTRSGVRNLPLHPALVEGLREWLYSGWSKHQGRQPTASDPVFCGERQLFRRPVSSRYIKADLAAVGRADIDAVFHDSRHTINSWMLEAGVAEVIRKQLLGHAGKDVTDEKYTARRLSMTAGAVNALPFTWRPRFTEKLSEKDVEKSELPSSSYDDSPSYDADNHLSYSVGGHILSDDTRLSGRIAKPSYVGSNPIHASIEASVSEAPVRFAVKLTAKGASPHRLPYEQPTIRRLVPMTAAELARWEALQ